MSSSHWWCCIVLREADRDVTKLELTNQFFDAVLVELAEIARGQLVLFVGHFNADPPRSLVCRKGSRLGSGLIWRLPLGWCWCGSRRSWDSPGGSRRDFLTGCPLAAAAAAPVC